MVILCPNCGGRDLLVQVPVVYNLITGDDGLPDLNGLAQDVECIQDGLCDDCEVLCKGCDRTGELKEFKPGAIPKQVERLLDATAWAQHRTGPTHPELVLLRQTLYSIHKELGFEDSELPDTLRKPWTGIHPRGEAPSWTDKE
jgi:hypothetical protein